MAPAPPRLGKRQTQEPACVDEVTCPGWLPETGSCLRIAAFTLVMVTSEYAAPSAWEIYRAYVRCVDTACINGPNFCFVLTLFSASR